MTGPPLGVVLAGGAARRMGDAGGKATVLLAGRPLLAYPLGALRETVGETVVACRADTPLPVLESDVAVWHEPGGPRHPLTGVIAALERAAGRSLLVVAGDMPLVRVEDLRALLDAGAGGRAAVAVGEGRLQPLLALYPPQARGVLAAMAPDEPAAAVVERLEPVLVDVPEETVLNVNRPEDLARAQALLAAR